MALPLQREIVMRQDSWIGYGLLLAVAFAVGLGTTLTAARFFIPKPQPAIRQPLPRQNERPVRGPTRLPGRSIRTVLC
ncbi:MAG: hypothetical protein R3C68_09710 [Myxococcota bacterium]